MKLKLSKKYLEILLLFILISAILSYINFYLYNNDSLFAVSITFLFIMLFGIISIESTRKEHLKFGLNTNKTNDCSDDNNLAPSYLTVPEIYDISDSRKPLVKFDNSTELIANDSDILITFINQPEQNKPVQMLIIYNNADVKLWDKGTNVYIVGKLTDAGLNNINKIVSNKDNFIKLDKDVIHAKHTMLFNNNIYGIPDINYHSDKSIEQLHNEIILFFNVFG